MDFLAFGIGIFKKKMAPDVSPYLSCCLFGEGTAHEKRSIQMCFGVFGITTCLEAGVLVFFDVIPETLM